MTDMKTRRITRPAPRRPARLYPIGTTLALRDGRTFEVATKPVRVWVDPTMGHGGGHMTTQQSRRFWRRINLTERTDA